MSFIKITTIHPDGREVIGITQQANVTAQEAFTRRAVRAGVARQPHDAVRAGVARQPHDIDRSTLTIRLHPTEVVDYEQLLEYAETIEAFDVIQPGLFEVTG
ncbi:MULTISPECIES: hypothetical protein [Brevibacterium]|uniref:Uncharacterized protein n=1 Tax=Brevibacterium antiquum CNRZ 918 TaxID=1255637 RepID=A0A2H1KDD3_9MICO|nr:MULTISPECIES: hypothetical protein [Brevibacterium]SMX97835.1 hypothetical protein BANT918_02363 [Brevibacterium antiquum CNRZ 918]HCG55353.1 hypothetical protein [Brevibacterium sp.]